MKLSVIICTHNPRGDYLQRVLNALRNQTLDKEHWELVIIDNGSHENLAEKWELGWHPQVRHFRENRLGIAHARLCGIAVSNGEVIVFVDDDNVLASNYLAVTADLAVQWPMIGAWSGNVVPEFEVSPGPEVQSLLKYLCVRKVDRDQWGSHCAESPWGAGMGVRREVAQAYWREMQNQPVRTDLGRLGTGLLGGEDEDIAGQSRSLGLGTALFRDLSLTHLFPERRLTEKYLLQLIEGIETSYVLENALRGKKCHADLQPDRSVGVLL